MQDFILCIHLDDGGDFDPILLTTDHLNAPQRTELRNNMYKNVYELCLELQWHEEESWAAFHSAAGQEMTCGGGQRFSPDFIVQTLMRRTGAAPTPGCRHCLLSQDASRILRGCFTESRGGMWLRMSFTLCEAQHYSLQKVLELLDLIDGDKSDLEDLSDNDDAILDADYQPPPREQSSTDDNSSGDEDPIPQPTEDRRGGVNIPMIQGQFQAMMLPDVATKLSRLRLMAQTMAQKSQCQDQAPRKSPMKDMEHAFPLMPDLSEFEHEDD
ncbi:hypothetical protein Q8A73_018096 [Channa argus]|nr:hypothetical protein Q8A73_018096 [Channa argus]